MENQSDNSIIARELQKLNSLPQIKESTLDLWLDKAASQGGTITGLLVMLASVILSFATLQETALHYNFGPVLSWLWPLLIDGFILGQALVLIRRSRLGFDTRFNIVLLVSFELASIVINGAAGAAMGKDIIDQVIGAIVHAVPPLALLLVSKSMSFDIKDMGKLKAQQMTLGAYLAAIGKAQEIAANFETEAQQKTKQLTNEIETKSATLAQLTQDRAQLEAQLSELKAQLSLTKKETKSATTPKAKAQPGASGAQPIAASSAIDNAEIILKEVWAQGKTITGADLGRRLGVSPQHGRNLHKKLWPIIAETEAQPIAQPITNGHHKNGSFSND